MGWWLNCTELRQAKPLPFLPLRGSGFWRGEKKSIYSSIHPSLPSHLPFSPYIQSCKPPTGEGSAQTPKIRESPDRKGGIEIEFSRVSTAWEKTQGSPFPGLIPLPSGSSRPAEPPSWHPMISFIAYQLKPVRYLSESPSSSTSSSTSSRSCSPPCPFSPLFTPPFLTHSEGLCHVTLTAFCVVMFLPFPV